MLVDLGLALLNVLLQGSSIVGMPDYFLVLAVEGLLFHIVSLASSSFYVVTGDPSVIV